MKRKRAFAIAYAKVPESGEEVEFLIPTNPENPPNTDDPIVQAEVSKMVQETRLEKGMAIYGAKPVYSLVEPKKNLDHFDFGNVLVEVNLPYCLHVPNGYEILVKDAGGGALVGFEKVWTKNASGSSETDVVEKTKVTFFNSGTITTGQIPHDKNSGWDHPFTGQNVEKTKDTKGYFRYTKLYLQIKSGFKESDFKEEKRLSKIEKTISDQTLLICNRILDVYRYVTKEVHIEPLADLHVPNIYFVDHNTGIYLTAMTRGIGSAMMNRSKQEIDEIERLLGTNEQLPVHELLLLSARSSLERSMHTLAVIQSFQALEIFIENFISDGLRCQGYSDQKIERLITADDNWRTKNRLTNLLKEVTGSSLSDKPTLWRVWPNKYRQRNKLIHKAEHVGVAAALEILDVNEAVIRWIAGLKYQTSSHRKKLRLWAWIQEKLNLSS